MLAHSSLQHLRLDCSSLGLNPKSGSIQWPLSASSSPPSPRKISVLIVLAAQLPHHIPQRKYSPKHQLRIIFRTERPWLAILPRIRTTARGRRRGRGPRVRGGVDACWQVFSLVDAVGCGGTRELTCGMGSIRGVRKTYRAGQICKRSTRPLRWWARNWIWSWSTIKLGEGAESVEVQD